MRTLTVQRMLELKRALAVTTGLSSTNGLVTATAAALLDDFTSTNGVLSPTNGETAIRLASSFAEYDNSGFTNKGANLNLNSGTYTNSSSDSANLVSAGYELSADWSTTDEGRLDDGEFGIGAWNGTYSVYTTVVGAFFVVDLGSEQAFDKIRIATGPDSYQAATSLTVSSAPDNSGSPGTYSANQTFTSIPDPADYEWIELLLDSPGSGRFVKVTVNSFDPDKINDPGGFSAVECQVMASTRATTLNTVDATFTFAAATSFAPSTLRVYSDAGTTELGGAAATVDYSVDGGSTFTGTQITLTDFRLLSATIFVGVPSNDLVLRVAPVGAAAIRQVSIDTINAGLDLGSSGAQLFQNGTQTADLQVGYDAATAFDKLTTTRSYLRTTNATPATIATIAVPDNTTMLINVEIVGNATDSSYRAAYRFDMGVYRAGGSATQLGSTSNVSTIESNVGLDASVAVSGNDALIQVTGIAATNINWQAIVRYQSASTTLAA